MKKHEMVEELHFQLWHTAAWLQSVHNRFQKGEATQQELLEAFVAYETTNKLAGTLLDYGNYANARMGLPWGLPTREDINKIMERGI